MITPGDLIDGRYIIGDLLGRGGMAEVHRATDVADGRAYAVKVVRGTEPGLDDRFRREAEALARVDHPGLIRLHRSGTHEGAHYLVLDLAEGPPLSQALAGGPAGVERTVSVGRQVAAALAPGGGPPPAPAGGRPPRPAPRAPRGASSTATSSRPTSCCTTTASCSRTSASPACREPPR